MQIILGFLNTTAPHANSLISHFKHFVYHHYIFIGSTVAECSECKGAVDPYIEGLSSCWVWKFLFMQHDGHPGQCRSSKYPQCWTGDYASDPHRGGTTHSGHQPPGRCRLAAVSYTSTQTLLFKTYRCIPTLEGSDFSFLPDKISTFFLYTEQSHRKWFWTQ